MSWLDFAVSAGNKTRGILRQLDPSVRSQSSLRSSPSLVLETNESGFDQWKKAMQSVARLDGGVPTEFRKKLWLMLANHYLERTGIYWEDVRCTVFYKTTDSADDNLGLQILKDLHRTPGLDSEEERLFLKRVLLAYSRYNKAIGYCQGFNIIVAMILEVMEFDEEQVLKVFIMLIEQVLPSGYFDHTLRALSVDMTVLHRLIALRLPRLAKHLDYLQKKTGAEYEPPLTDVFTMQWFLTLFATALPKETVFRVWDSLMLEGSEILLRTGIAIWATIGSKKICQAQTADGFYGLMGPICQQLLQLSVDQSNELIQLIYSMAEFPYPGLPELREQCAKTCNVEPVSSAFSILKSEGNNNSIECLPPAANVNELDSQYKRLLQRQQQAAIIVEKAYAHRTSHSPYHSPGAVANGASPRVFNHLSVDSNARSLRTLTLSAEVAISSVAIQPNANTRLRATLEHSPVANNGLIQTYDEVFNTNQRASTQSIPRSLSTPATVSDTSYSCLVSSCFSTTVNASGEECNNKPEGKNAIRRRHSSPLYKDQTQEATEESGSIKAKSCFELSGAVLSDDRHPVFQGKREQCQYAATFVGTSSTTTPPFLLAASLNATGVTNNIFSSVVTNSPLAPSVGSKHATTVPVKKLSRRKTTSESSQQQNSNNNNAILEKSRLIVDSAFAESERKRRNFVNPFPVQHKTVLIDRGKRFGLY